MYILKTESCFDSAHFLSGYEGKCSNLHGHRWKVVIEIEGESLSEDPQTRGMLVDFSRFKKDLREETSYLDHALIMEKDSISSSVEEDLKNQSFRIVQLPYRPTAENLAKYMFDKMTSKGYTVKSATVYETEDNCASYLM